jgi:hypothetical protein
MLLINIYFDYLPTVTITTAIIGFFAGLIEQTIVYITIKNNRFFNITNISNTINNAKQYNYYNKSMGLIFFNNIFGYISFSIIVGILYPITIPLYSIYIIHNKKIH